MSEQTTRKICEPSDLETGEHQFSGGSNTCDFCGMPGILLDGVPLYVPNPKQMEYHTRTEPNLLFWGGRGSGKSVCARWDAHMRALSHPGFSYCILRRKYPQLEASHLKFIGQEMMQLGGTFNQTSRIAKYPNGSTGFFSHCATREDVLNLLSAEFDLMVFDELSTFEWEMFTDLSSSVRSKKKSGLSAMVRGLTNPLGTSAQQLLRYFVNKDVDLDEDPEYNPNDWGSIHANLIDNPHLDRDEYRKRFSGLAAHVRKAWDDGEFILENALFDLRPSRDGKPYHVIHDIDLPKVIQASTIYRAIDAGWFPDPTVVLWVAHLGNRHIIFHEKTWYKTTAEEIAKDIKAEDARLGIGRVAMTYCDPSMDINTTADIRTIAQIYEANGVPMEASINNREMFAITMHNALAEEADEQTPRLQIYSAGKEAGCPMLIRTIPQMQFDEKHPKALANHRDDHWVIAACYYLMSHSSDPRKEITEFNRPRRWMIQKPSDRLVLGRDNVRSPYKPTY